MAVKKKNKVGRPTKYKAEYVSMAEELCREKGYTDKNLATHFKIAEDTIYEWKKRYSEFTESIKKGKDEFDSRIVEQALLKRALGYSYIETTREPWHIKEGEEASQKLVVTKKVTKQMAPEVVAQIFWLKNRQTQRWSDKKEIDHRIEGITEPLTEEELLARLEKARAAGTGIDKKSIEGNGNSQ